MDLIKHFLIKHYVLEIQSLNLKANRYFLNNLIEKFDKASSLAQRRTLSALLILFFHSYILIE